MLNDGPRHSVVQLLVFFAVSIAVAAAQEVPSAEGSLSVDLSRYYFKTPQEEVDGRTELNAALKRLEQLKGQLNSGSGLLGFLQQNDIAQKLFAKHDDYLYLRCSLNRKDSACEEEAKLDSEFHAKAAFFEPAILAIPDDRLRYFLSQEPKLKQFWFEISNIRRNGPHLLPEAQQRFLDELRPEIADWQYDLYDKIIAGIPFGTVQTSAGPLDVIRQRNLIASSTDTRVREEGFKKCFAGYASQRDLVAFALLHTVRAQQTLAKAHHYDDAPSRKYESLYFKPEETRNLLALMAEHGDIPKRYEEIRSHDVEQDYHHPARAWDMSAPSPGLTAPITRLPDVRRIFHDVFAGLGKEYQSAFDALLDPANGRADILPGGAASRYGGGFSLGAGGAGILFYGRFDGTFKDLSVIAHEGGHATHRQLMIANGVSRAYQHGPNFLFESFAEFNELLLADYMAEHAGTPELQRYYRKRWMYIKGLDAFDGAQDALLEQSIYDGVSAGTIRNADDLDSLSLKIDRQFSQFPDSTPELRSRWAMVSLMFEDPLYDVNYVYGGLLALKYFQLYSTRREWFVPRYIALLKNGFDQAPATMLTHFLEIDVSGPALLKDDLELLNRRLDQMDATAAGK
jgi:oligoendopeptidase F